MGSNVDFDHVQSLVIAKDTDAALLALMPWVHRVAGTLLARLPANIEKDDLVQAGMIAAWECTKTWNVEGGAAYKTFVYHRVAGAMLDVLRSTDTVSRTMRRRIKTTTLADSDLRQRLGRTPLESEIAVASGLSLEQVRESARIGYENVSLAIEGIVDEDGEIHETVMEDFCAESPEKILGDQQVLLLALDHVAKLSDREQIIMKCLYIDGSTQQDIAELYNISPSRVNQIHIGVLGEVQELVRKRTFRVCEHTRPRNVPRPSVMANLKLVKPNPPLSGTAINRIDAILNEISDLVQRDSRRVSSGLESEDRRATYDSRFLSLTVRAGHRQFEDRIFNTVELLSINVALSKQNMGICARVLDYLEALAQVHGRLFVVDNVINHDFQRRLSARPGYVAQSFKTSLGMAAHFFVIPVEITAI